MRWYVSRQGKRKGPFDKADILAAIEARQIGPDDTLCQEGTEDWLRVRELGAFAAALPAPASPAPASPVAVHVPPIAGPASPPAHEAPQRRTGPLHGATLWIDRLEKVGRLVLWLVLAAAVLLVPVEYIKQQRAESALREAVRKEELQRLKADKEKAEKSDRLPLASIAPWLSLLDGAAGRMWFSNASPRSGIVCVTGIATNPTTKQTSESLAGCKNVLPYTSSIQLDVMFAGGDLRTICKDVTCSLSFREVADAK